MCVTPARPDPRRQHLRSSAPAILAAGDIASFPLPLCGGQRVSVGHWGLAHYLGSLAGRVAAGADTQVDTVPFFWTVQYGKSVRYTGESWAGSGKVGGDDVVVDVC